MNKWEKAVARSQLDDEKAVLEALETHYRNALKDIEINIQLLSANAELMQSKMYQLSYQNALRDQVGGILQQLQTNSFTTIAQYLETCYQNGFIGTMYSIASQGIPLIAPLNQDAIVRATMTNSKLSDKLYETLGHDMKELKKNVTGEITRGIASGSSWQEIGRNIGYTSGIPMRRAETIARTEGHRVQEEASADARNAAKERGCDVVKQWDSTLDGNTRETHQALDGQIRETDKPFEIGTKKAMYPGDFGLPEEDINCRCVALTRARWGLDEDELNTLKERAEYFGLDKKDSFEEYKKNYLESAGTVKNNGADSVKNCKDFDELSDHLLKKYGIMIDDDVKKLDYDSVQSSFIGIDSVLNEVPELQNLITSAKTGSSFMACSFDGVIEFNENIFSDKKTIEDVFKRNIATGYWIKGSSAESVGAHEASHLIEKLLIQYSGKYQSRYDVVEAWNNCTEAKAIVSQACKNIKKTPFGKGKRNADLLDTISGYASKDASEALADSFESIYIHGEKASPLALEIKRLTLETLKTYKNGV